jgi:hypothetical protein
MRKITWQGLLAGVTVIFIAAVGTASWIWWKRLHYEEGPSLKMLDLSCAPLPYRYQSGCTPFPTSPIELIKKACPENHSSERSPTSRAARQMILWNLAPVYPSVRPTPAIPTNGKRVRAPTSSS